MKKIISCLILCAMLIGVFSMGAFAENEADNTRTQVSLTDYLNGTTDYTKSDFDDIVLTIGSADELEKFNTSNPHSNLKNAYIKITADIDYTGKTWKGIIFDGTFDGDGHTVTGITVSDCSTGCGMFRQAGGTIKSLTVADITVDASSGNAYSNTATSNIGAIVGARANNNVNISNLVIDNVHVINATVKGSGQVGGIIGSTNGLNGNKKTVDIKNCSFSGTLNGTSDVGGIVGYGSNAGSLSVSNCSVSLTGSLGATSNVGSLIGRTKITTTLKNCVVAYSEYNSDNFVGTVSDVTVDTGTCRTVSASADCHGYQKKAHDGNIDYRLIGVLDLGTATLADFGDIGFLVTLTYNGSVKTEKVSCKAVYSSVLGGGIKYTTEEATGDGVQHIDADYLYALVIPNVPEDAEVSVSVTSYLTVGEGDNAVSTFGSTQALTLKK